MVRHPPPARHRRVAAGIAQGREAPSFSNETFAGWFASREPRHDAAKSVILWPDTFTNYFEPEVGEAAVRVLEAAGFRVRLPDVGRPLCCGRPLYDYGMLSTAKRWLSRTVTALRPYLRDGTPIVGLEPSCVVQVLIPGELRALGDDRGDQVEAVLRAVRRQLASSRRGSQFPRAA